MKSQKAFKGLLMYELFSFEFLSLFFLLVGTFPEIAISLFKIGKYGSLVPPVERGLGKSGNVVTTGRAIALKSSKDFGRS